MCRNILRLLWFVSSFTFLLFLFSVSSLKAQDVLIKSLRVYSSSDQTEFPVIDYSESPNQKITIEFDIQSQFEPNLNILFRFCDSDWNPYDNAFLLNPMYNTEHNLLLDRLPITVHGAHYHYSGSFPNNNVQFPFSGKWMFFITDPYNRDRVFGSGKFFVIRPQIKLDIQLSQERQDGEIPDLMARGRTIGIHTNFVLPDSLFPNNVRRVEIIQNRKFSYPIVIDRINNTQDCYYEWNASNKFSFIARNIKPGNEYRQTDIRDVGKYTAAKATAKFGEIETSDFFTRRKRDYNGGSYLMNYKNDNADYINVVFKIRPPEEIRTSVFLVGSFTNWKVLPEYEMFDDNGMMNLSVELKRGVYDYQYVTGNVANNVVENIDWEVLEGNFYETQNEFLIFLYYSTEEKGGYDKIIGVKKIKTGIQ